ncbi:MAG: hypothetical protein P4L53_06345 [Candidatus Obscuribacterales bacterium]|nr:hypothetical protein [Candidatus Obscuribacterales bacterium]
MLDVIDSFSRRRAESVELLRSAAVSARNLHQASSEISAWCDRDVIRQKGDEHDSRDYLTESIRYVMRIGQEAQVRRSRFVELAAAIQTKIEQLDNDAQELREVDLLDSSHFQTIRDLNIQLLQVKQWADDDERIYEQAVESLEGLFVRFVVVYPITSGALSDTPMMQS